MQIINASNSLNLRQYRTENNILFCMHAIIPVDCIFGWYQIQKELAVQD